MKTTIFILFAVFLFGCRTVYVDRPYYVSVKDSVLVRDATILICRDTVKTTVAAPLKNKIAKIDNKNLFAKAWIMGDSLFLVAGLKHGIDTAKVKETIRYITNTPAPIVIDKPQYIYKNSDRFMENQMYYSGWAAWCLLIGGAIALIIRKFVFKL